MQFKRCGLVPDRPFVNACLSAGLLFLIGCGQQGDSGTPRDTAPNANNGSVVSVPAVWSTRPLESAVEDIALAGGAASTIAVIYEDGAVQFFNLEGDRTTDMASLDAGTVAPGTYLLFGETGLTLFPGINQSGGLIAYAHSEGLPAPVELALPIETSGSVDVLCSRALGADDDGDLEIAFWGAGEDTATFGTLGTDGDMFTFQPKPGPAVPASATDCAITTDGVSFNVSGSAIGTLARQSSQHFVFLTPAGALTSAKVGEDATPLAVRDGISVKLPSPVRAMDALGQPLGGGYPGGVIVVAGETDSGHQLVFIDATNLTSVESN